MENIKPLSNNCPLFRWKSMMPPSLITALFLDGFQSKKRAVITERGIIPLY
jgi:hypothetical protein